MFWLKVIISPSPSTCLNEILVTWGIRWPLLPLTYVSSNWHRPFFQLVSQCRQSLCIGCHFFSGNFSRLAKAYNARHIEGTGTHAPLVTATIHLGSDFYPWVFATNVKGANTFRAVHLCEVKAMMYAPFLLD